MNYCSNLSHTLLSLRIFLHVKRRACKVICESWISNTSRMIFRSQINDWFSCNMSAIGVVLLRRSLCPTRIFSTLSVPSILIWVWPSGISMNFARHSLLCRGTGSKGGPYFTMLDSTLDACSWDFQCRALHCLVIILVVWNLEFGFCGLPFPPHYHVSHCICSSVVLAILDVSVTVKLIVLSALSTWEFSMVCVH